MSQLFFTCSQIPDERFLTLESLFDRIPSNQALLVFDTNVVIHYRDFYFLPKEIVISSPLVYGSIRYLIEQIHRYNLTVDYNFGVDESSRSIYDFSIIDKKRAQTHRILKTMIEMSIDDFDQHIKIGTNARQEIKKEEFPDSKITCLKSKSSFQNLLIVSYVVALKIYILFSEISQNKISKIDALSEFLIFLDEEADCVTAAFISYAFYLFGGYSELKPLIFSNDKLPNKKLHKIFNGAIDLIFPVSSDLFVEKFNQLTNDNAIPVFVTMDKYISVLHSVINTKIFIESINNKQAPQFSEVSFRYLKHTSWIKEELDLFNINLKSLNNRRILKYSKQAKSTEELIETAMVYETMVKVLISK